MDKRVKLMLGVMAGEFRETVVVKLRDLEGISDDELATGLLEVKKSAQLALGILDDGIAALQEGGHDQREGLGEG